MHATGLIYREEGLRGLYRGYIPYMMATTIFWGLVPLLAEVWLQSQPISGNYQDQTGNLLEEISRLDKAQLIAAVSGKRKKED